MKTMVRRLRHLNAMMVHMDVRRRTLREVFRDWQRSPWSLEWGVRTTANQRRCHQAMSWRTYRMILNEIERPHAKISPQLRQ